METYKFEYSSDRNFSSKINLGSNILISDNAKILGFTMFGFKIGFNYKGNYEIATFRCRDRLMDFVLHETFYGSHLWDYKITVKTGYYYSLKICIDLNINIDFIDKYLNDSCGLNLLIIKKYESMEDIRRNTSVDSKSYLPYNGEQNVEDKFKIELYSYQKKSLRKMINIENNNESFKIQQSVNINFGDEQLVYDPIKGCRVDKHIYSRISSKGGILADEMGLGKTITSLSLIASNPSTQNYLFFNNKIYSKATLLICPNHLAKQWVKEAKKACPKMKTILIATKTNHVKLNYEDFKNADFIIVTQQFLMNFKYYPSLEYKKVTASSISLSDREQHMNNKLKEWRKSVYINDDSSISCNSSDYQKEWDEIKSKTSPIIEMFYFHRVLIDEGHEIFGEALSNGSLSVYISEYLRSVSADYFWYISGTPFFNSTGMINCLDFIKLKYITNNNNHISFDRNSTRIYKFLLKKELLERVLSTICIRHRKEDVENQVQIPGYEEKIEWVELSELERNLYKSREGKSSNHILQQICCHPLVAESYHQIIGNKTVSLDEMKEKIIDYHEKKIIYYKSKLENLNENSTEYHMLKNTFTTKLTESKFILDVLKKINEKVKEDDDNCIICFDKMENPALTPCGHLFCHECLKMCIHSKPQCPICKADLKNKEIMLLNKNKPKVNPNSNPLVQKYGAKLGKIISMIRSLVSIDETRIIVFSQWDRMLTLIGSSLSECGIENSFVKGNVWARNSAIDKFKLGINRQGKDNKVIMLSLKNSASGTNLTEATHIFFVEPINAPKMECKSIEGQAIGRACRLGQKNKINVIRVLTKNTIEEDIYRKSYEEINNENNNLEI